MKVVKLIELLERAMQDSGNKEMTVEIPNESSSFEDVAGISVCEEGSAVIICDKATYDSFRH